MKKLNQNLSSVDLFLCTVSREELALASSTLVIKQFFFRQNSADYWNKREETDVFQT